MRKRTECSPCLLWPGAKDKDGYGFVKIHGRQYRAHRVALANKIGRQLQPWEIVSHLCDHPSCVNPEHLEISNVAENNRRARERRCTLAKNILGVSGYGEDAKVIA